MAPGAAAAPSVAKVPASGTSLAMAAAASPPELPASPEWRRWASPFAILALMLTHHWGLWLVVSRHRGLALLDLLDHWDAAHYSNIVRQGQHGDQWAFLPLYPLLVGRLADLTAVAPQLVGTLLSTALLAAFVAAVLLRAPRTPKFPGLAPASPWGWFLLLYSPASYALHSHHTEALFLLLSFLAFSFAASGAGFTAGVFAGLSLLTRLQGQFVALTVPFLCASVAGKEPVRAVRFFDAAVAASGFLLALLIYEQLGSGSPLAFLTAHGAWTHAHSAAEVLRTFWMGNPWQSVDEATVPRELFWFGWVALALVGFRRQPPLAAYLLLSAAMLPLMAELGTAFRYQVVLFPLAFVAGDWLCLRPWWQRWPVVPLLVVLNHWTTLNYAVLRWAY